jgi:hypothetical protein
MKDIPKNVWMNFYAVEAATSERIGQLGFGPCYISKEQTSARAELHPSCMEVAYHYVHASEFQAALDEIKTLRELLDKIKESNQ